MNKKLAFRYVFEVIVIVFSVTLSFYIQELLSDREKNLLKNDKSYVEDESLEDTFIDIANYGIIGILLGKGKWK